MKGIKFLFLTVLFSTAYILSAAAQDKVTGLSSVKLYIDPGHGGTDNMGMYNWSESEKVVRVGQYLEQYLLKYTDMQAQNFMFSRKSDSDSNTALSTRTSESRTFGAHFYYSIHSDAAGMGSSTNRNVFLYGGRRTSSGQPVIEKLPEGGREFGNHLTRDLTSIMRVPSRNLTAIPVYGGGENGNIADLTFYGSGNTTPYLAVNNGTNGYIASILSEMGFHTNPEQNALNMSEGYMKALAYATYQSMVRYMTNQSWGGGSKKEPVQVGILHGFIVEEQANSPINSATITVSKDGSIVATYKTDSYDPGTRFSQKYPAGKGDAIYGFYTDVLRNGFYWIENLTPGETYTVKVEAPGFETKDNLSITIPTSVGTKTIDGLGTLDVKMKNIMPGIVLGNDIVNTEKVPLNRLIRITFARGMDQSAMASAFKITEADGGAVATAPISWQSGVLQVDVSQLDFETDYVLTIDGALAKVTGYDIGIDGARTGSVSDYVVNFRTEAATPPKVVSFSPQGTEQFMLRPVVRIELDQHAVTSSIASNQLTVVDKEGAPVAGIQSYNAMGNGKSVFHYIFNANLTANERYTVTFAKGIKNVYGNATEEDFVFTFVPRNQSVTVNTPALNQFSGTMGSFGGGSQIGGIVANSYSSSQDASVKLTAQSANSHRVNYQWNDDASLGTAGDPRPGIRHHYGTTTPTFTTSAGTLQYWVFGDGSNSQVSVIIAPTAGGYFVKRTKVDWVGWKMLSWELSSNAGVTTYLADGTMSGNLRFAGVNIVGPTAVADRDLNASSLWFSDMRLVTLGAVEGIFTVTFNTQGGSAVPSGYYTANEPIDALPTSPIRPGYSFAGWHKDTAGDQPWDLENDAVTNNITLYAKWESLVESHSPADGETDVSLRPVIRIEFREPLDPESIDYEYQLSVKDDGGAGTYASGELSYQTEDGKGILLFTFDHDLFASTEYLVKLDPGYKTAIGVEMPDEVVFSFTTENENSISIPNASSVSIYPNPTSGELTLQFDAAGAYNVTVSDVTGRNLLRQSTTGMSMQIDISSCDAGIYLIIIDDGTKQTPMRVVKQ